MAEIVPMWLEETGRRYPDALVVFCHGDDRYGEWVLVPDNGFAELPPIEIHDAIRRLRKQYGETRRIVFMTCNPGHYAISEPNVSYNLDSVWLVPDRYLNPRSGLDPATSGNIFEFVEN